MLIVYSDIFKLKLREFQINVNNSDRHCVSMVSVWGVPMEIMNAYATTAINPPQIGKVASFPIPSEVRKKDLYPLF